MNPATQVEAEAARWLARRDAGDWGPEDECALKEWTSASTAHRVAYLRLESAWTKADRLRVLGPGAFPGDGAETPADIPAPGDRPRRMARLGGALAALAVAASVAWFFLDTGRQYTTPTGGFERVALADGSRIELNTATRLDVAYSQAERRVALERGEAFFDVAKDRRRPFVVTAGDYRVTAVGTAFSVRLESDDINVLVTEGRVRIEASAPTRSARKPMLLSAGQVADLKADALAVTAVPETDYDYQLGWREGMLVFDDRPLHEVAAEFNRYNRTQLVVADPRVGAATISATFRPTNLSGFIRLLERGFSIEAVRVNDDRIVLRAAE